MPFKLCYTLPLLLLLGACNFNAYRKNTPAGQDSNTPDAAAPDTAASLIQPDLSKADPGQYCYIRDIYTIGDTTRIDADYVQFFINRQADSVATLRRDGVPEVNEKGDTSWSPPDGYYVLNVNRKIRSLNLAKNMNYYTVEAGDKIYLKKYGLKKLQETFNKDALYILTFNGHQEVTTIKEQYLP